GQARAAAVVLAETKRRRADDRDATQIAGTGRSDGMNHEPTLTKLQQRFSADGFTTSEFRDNLRLIVKPDRLYALLECLKQQCGFDMLIDITAADYLHYPDARDRFGVIYALLNVTTGERIYVKVFVNEPDPTLPSAFPLWKGADWMEREVYD